MSDVAPSQSATKGEDDDPWGVFGSDDDDDDDDEVQRHGIVSSQQMVDGGGEERTNEDHKKKKKKKNACCNCCSIFRSIGQTLSVQLTQIFLKSNSQVNFSHRRVGIFFDDDDGRIVTSTDAAATTSCSTSCCSATMKQTIASRGFQIVDVEEELPPRGDSDSYYCGGNDNMVDAIVWTQNVSAAVAEYGEKEEDDSVGGSTLR